MAAKYAVYLTTLVIFAIIENSSSAIYMRNHELNVERDISEYERHKQHALHHTSGHHHSAATVTEARADMQQRHHQSYDKIHDVVDDDDVVVVGDSSEVVALHTHTQSRNKRELSDWLIAPNTRWCGRGNTAVTYNNLGGSAADKCCRKHDHCQLFIPAFQSRYELFNFRPHTLSHCGCDRRFHTCLKMAHDEDANTIGKLFFNVVQMQCFILRNEKLCQKRAPDGSCEREQVRQKAILKTAKKF